MDKRSETSIVPYCFYTVRWMVVAALTFPLQIFYRQIQKRRSTVFASRCLFGAVGACILVPMGIWGYHTGQHDTKLRNEWVEVTAHFDKSATEKTKQLSYTYVDPGDDDSYTISDNRLGSLPTETIWVSSESGRIYFTDPGEWWGNSNPSAVVLFMCMGFPVLLLLGWLIDWTARQVDWNISQHKAMVEAKAQS